MLPRGSETLSSPVSYPRLAPFFYITHLQCSIDRRAQTYYTDSVGAATDDEAYDDDYYRDEEAEIDYGRVLGGELQQSPIVGDLQWDEDMTPRASSENESCQGSSPQYDIRQYVSSPTQTPTPAANAAERTPLLRKQSASSALRRPSYPSIPSDESTTTIRNTNVPPAALQRRISQLSRRSSQQGPISKNNKHVSGGQSTFGQTVCHFQVIVPMFLCSSHAAQLFNSIAILLGIGMLSEPLAFAHAGWIGGSILILFYGFLTCYTYVHIVTFKLLHCYRLMHSFMST